MTSPQGLALGIFVPSYNLLALEVNTSPFICLFSHNLSPFIKIVYKPLSLTTFLGLHFISMKVSLHTEIKIITSNEIRMPCFLLICFLSVWFAGPEAEPRRTEERIFSFSVCPQRRGQDSSSRSICLELSPIYHYGPSLSFNVFPFCLHIIFSMKSTLTAPFKTTTPPAFLDYLILLNFFFITSSPSNVLYNLRILLIYCLPVSLEFKLQKVKIFYLFCLLLYLQVTRTISGT